MKKTVVGREHFIGTYIPDDINSMLEEISKYYGDLSAAGCVRMFIKKEYDRLVKNGELSEKERA